MKVCLDVHYGETAARVGAVSFLDWADGMPAGEKVIGIGKVAPYEPGQFFRRELPCLLAMLRELPPPETVIVDGYVWLDGSSRPGLGAHLFEALKTRVPVIGVAKTKFRGASGEGEIFRGESTRPLYVTAAGMAAEAAAESIRTMHGEHRIPTLLKRVDWLCRQGEAK